MILYATWSFIFFLVTLDMSLKYEYDLPREKTHTIIIFLIYAKLISYFLVENYVSYKYCKFLFSPWLIIGTFIVDTFISHVLVRNKLKIVDSFRYKLQDFELNLFYTKVNLNNFLLACLVIFFTFLLFIKSIKFIWQELCYKKKFSQSF
jgi:hypothetical protein